MLYNVKTSSHILVAMGLSCMWGLHISRHSKQRSDQMPIEGLNQTRNYWLGVPRNHNPTVSPKCQKTRNWTTAKQEETRKTYLVKSPQRYTRRPPWGHTKRVGTSSRPVVVVATAAVVVVVVPPPPTPAVAAPAPDDEPSPNICIQLHTFVCLSVSFLPTSPPPVRKSPPPPAPQPLIDTVSSTSPTLLPSLTTPLSHLFSSLSSFPLPPWPKQRQNKQISLSSLSLSLARSLVLRVLNSTGHGMLGFFFCKIEECPENCWSADQRMQTVKLGAMIICSRGAANKIYAKKTQKRSKRNASAKP